VDFTNSSFAKNVSDMVRNAREMVRNAREGGFVNHGDFALRADSERRSVRTVAEKLYGHESERSSSSSSSSSSLE
jgi:hypothetical protein